MATLAFLLDVDNTLLDNDALKALYDARLREIAGAARTERFWRVYEDVRADRGIVDYPETFARLGREIDASLLAEIERAIYDAPFARFVFEGAFDAIAQMRVVGATVILSDGDATYQPLKIERSGLARAVEGNVLIYPHKEARLTEVMARFPAERYVQVDDKAALLGATKQQLGDRVTTVHVRQGHYAEDPTPIAPDLSIDRIGDLATLPPGRFAV